MSSWECMHLILLSALHILLMHALHICDAVVMLTSMGFEGG